MAPTVTATYRLQLHAGFGFADAAEQVPYLARLGISHLYLSPILAAVPGSMHGYDVLDHGRVSDELGGEQAFRALAAKAREHGLGLVVDVVPNHMAFVAPEWTNAPLWQVLRDGRDAATAHWFDIDWDVCNGRLGLPILGDTLQAILAAGDLVLDRLTDGPLSGEPVIRYHDHVLPVAPETLDPAGSAPDLADLLAAQHYLLASWREAEQVLGYRRFFDVNQLIAVRVELPDVFEATHRLLLGLHHEGLIDGFRIDHPDGLADPEGYLDQLRGALRPGTPVWVEKILEGDEDLPTTWPCQGTTGYDAMQVVATALVDPATVDVVSGTWEATGGTPSIDPVVDASKRLVVADLLQPEVGRLHRAAAEALPDLDAARLREAIEEVLVGFEVYRAYIRPGHEATLAALEHLDDAVRRAREGRPDLAAEVDAVAAVATHPDEHTPAAVDFAVRLQQTCGPVMAKGIEDTAFYRWHRLTALNEVGGDPQRALDPQTQDLHVWAERQQREWPLGMTALSTHDTKRSADVRARILAVAGDGGAWRRCSQVAARAAQEFDVDRPTAHLIWQTLVGAGRISEERLHGYLLKAVREAKEHTAWVDGDEDYERKVLRFASTALDGGPLHDAVADAVEASAGAIRALTLGARLLQLCLPGVPDTYQGCELVDLSLVDPDNRRPVDFAEGARRLGRLDAGEPARDLADEKLLMTSKALRLRAARPDSLGERSSYEVLDSTSPHALGFLRGDVACLITRTPHALAAQGGWGDERVQLPDGQWCDELTGRVLAGGVLRYAELFEDLPVALVVRQ